VLGSSFMFFLTRFIALIMRAYMSRNSYNIHLVCESLSPLAPLAAGYWWET
jgi:hypothetical protein